MSKIFLLDEPPQRKQVYQSMGLLALESRCVFFFTCVLPTKQGHVGLLILLCFYLFFSLSKLLFWVGWRAPPPSDVCYDIRAR